MNHSEFVLSNLFLMPTKNPVAEVNIPVKAIDAVIF